MIIKKLLEKRKEAEISNDYDTPQENIIDSITAGDIDLVNIIETNAEEIATLYLKRDVASVAKYIIRAAERNNNIDPLAKKAADKEAGEERAAAMKKWSEKYGSGSDKNKPGVATRTPSTNRDVLGTDEDTKGLNDYEREREFYRDNRERQ